VLLAAVAIAACSSPHTSTPTSASAVLTFAPAPTTTAAAAAPTTSAASSQTTPGEVSPAVLTGISMTSVPTDVIVPTSPASLDKETNPINGRRGGDHPLASAASCTVDLAAPRECMVLTLDLLGFNVAPGSGANADRRMQRATAVLQLDAGLPMTGLADDAVYRYLGVSPDRPRDPLALEQRAIGTSAQHRSITAYRYGHGPKVVMVVAETHGDEEAGLRVWLRMRTHPVPAGTTVWVVPMLNPDGLLLDTRFLADGADPNRAAPAEPEQKAVVDFATTVRPVLTVWYHQNYGWIGGSGASMVAAERYHTITHLGALNHSGDCKFGFMWCPIDTALGSSSILVELPDVVTPADVQLHADALLTVIADVAR